MCYKHTEITRSRQAAGRGLRSYIPDRQTAARDLQYLGPAGSVRRTVHRTTTTCPAGAISTRNHQHPEP